ADEHATTELEHECRPEHSFESCLPSIQLPGDKQQNNSVNDDNNQGDGDTGRNKENPILQSKQRRREQKELYNSISACESNALRHVQPHESHARIMLLSSAEVSWRSCSACIVQTSSSRDFP